MSGHVLLIGPGDLGQRLANCSEVGELVLAGRRPEGEQWLAEILSVCGSALVRSVMLDASHLDAVAHVLDRERPQLVVQNASLLSPWHLTTRETSFATATMRAGFAVQLPARLALVLTVMSGAG
jgi:hypothetical protein